MKAATASVCTLLAAGLALAQVSEPPPARFADQAAVANEDFQVLTRGPMHEAFAAPYSGEPEPGIIVDKQPPQPIDEVPPEYAPEGENVVWVPGYWGWDPKQDDFVWISGVWRQVPPDQTWVPGYWAQVDDGFQWVSGFWNLESNQELVYLPYPPENLEQGPTSPAPDGDFFWVPGCWTWNGTDYQWRPGYWAKTQSEWVWIPATYNWTPYGCVFVQGYWDYQLEERGTVFAPVYFRPEVYQRPGYRYAPSHVIHVALTIGQWFISPRAHHYYYGNYFGGNYARVGLLPWYEYPSRRGAYDPLLTYYNWYYARQNVNFADRLRDWHHYYVQHEDHRPPDTLVDQRRRLERGDDGQVGRFRLARSIQELTQDNDSPIRFRRLEPERRQRFEQFSQAIRERRQERGRFESSLTEFTEGRQGEQAERAVRRLQLPGIPGIQTDRPGERNRDVERPGERDRERPMDRDRDRPGDRDRDRPTEKDRGRPDIDRERPGERNPIERAQEALRQRQEAERQKQERKDQPVPDRRPGADQQDRTPPGLRAPNRPEQARPEQQRPSPEEGRRGEPRGFDPRQIQERREQRATEQKQQQQPGQQPDIPRFNVDRKQQPPQGDQQQRQQPRRDLLQGLPDQLRQQRRGDGANPPGQRPDVQKQAPPQRQPQTTPRPQPQPS